MIEFTVIREFHKPENNHTKVYYETELVISDAANIKVFSKLCQSIAFHPPKSKGIYVNEVYVPAGSNLLLQPCVEKHLAVIDQIFEVLPEPEPEPEIPS